MEEPSATHRATLRRRLAGNYVAAAWSRRAARLDGIAVWVHRTRTKRHSYQSMMSMTRFIRITHYGSTISTMQEPTRLVSVCSLGKKKLYRVIGGGQRVYLTSHQLVGCDC
ncbi:actin cytoskeleton organization protein (Cro1) [Histoplasma capsulatum var. duboisii H88]|uniref:Actin cytoskeleton organization protein (Cro1) n=1 Tax=Ajellomyces capsulatus (strain H88) TaxID=544711 RepID=A0A8A1LGR8_AJEC8|nr:actin cytoskeleton organization protein (Cro1) [Histoplasma capsulatum var. duboisii H88]